ncbi:2721_t:CDS:2 [Diversispora eburnea]|uniref:2721_t:CDS:1 n=1 Tax=Diversispora eburnea TaxID=1213867 RepID=A0A9N9BIP8_9GLOM|nr:2721_t:CDS:2 [Diversispora eburnea]
MLLTDKAQKLEQFSKIRHHDILVDQLTALYFIDIDYRLFKQKLATIQKSYKRLYKENLHSSSSPPSPLLADQIMLHLINAALEQIDKKHLEYFEKQFKKSSGGKRFAMLLSKLRLRSQLLFKSMIIWVKELIFGKIVGGIKEFFYKIGQALREPHYHDNRYSHNSRRHNHLKDEFPQELKDHYEDYKHRELLEQQEEFEIKRTEVEEGYKDFISSLQSLLPQLCNENNIVRNKLNSQQLFLLRSRKNSFSHSRESSYSFGMTSMSSISNSTTPTTSTPTTTTFAPITPINTNFTNITPLTTPNSSSITNKSTSQIYSSSPISTTFNTTNINAVTINTTNLSNISSFNSNTTTPTTTRTDSYNNIFDSPISPTFDTPRSSIYTTNTTTNTNSSFKEGFLTFTSVDWFLLVLVKVTGQYIEEQLDLLNMTEEEEAQWIEFRKLYQLMVGLFHSVTEK